MSYIISVCLFRFLLPLLLLTCVVFRPSALSGIYLIITLLSAFTAVPTRVSMRGWTGIYLKLLIGLSVLTVLMVSGFQVYLIATGTYGEVLIDNQNLETVFRYCGFVRLDNADFVTIVTWISPELLMLLTTVIIFVLSKKLTASTDIIESEIGEEHRPKAKMNKMEFLVGIGKYAILLLLCICAALRPSVQGGLYFIVFICSATWLSCSKDLGKGFGIVIRSVMVVLFLHILALFLFQIHYFQGILGPDSPYQRYFALTMFYTVDETVDPRQFIAVTNEWDSILNPLMLILLFYVSALVTKELMRPKLMRGVSPSRRYGSDKKKGPSILQDSTGSVIVSSEDQPQDDNNDDRLGPDEEERPTCLENCIFVMEQLMQFIVQISYIATNIIMMTWSITYHSWLTFVLLIWANLLWILPNQRKNMLTSSPFLVLYAIFLLISGYIYSMNLTEEELPSQLAHINLAQIGFIKILEFPCKDLLAKCMFTIMFWFTLKQYTVELKQAKQQKSLADMAAPLQVTVGTAAGVPSEQADNREASEAVKKIEEYLTKLFIRVWIWIVAITLFVVAITGERMTVFRILYMALFLFFILTFQLSFSFWRRMMFTFLLVVIAYSMLILILVYTYQFDNFVTYWGDYLLVPEEQQKDIGLEKYQTTQLFVRLATPTCFVIVTVIQLHYFHKDFLQLTNESSQHPQVARMTSLVNSSMPDSASEPQDSEISDGKIDLTDVGTISSKQLKRSYIYFSRKCQKVLNMIYVYLEIQMHRFVLLIGALMCIYDKCALYSIVIPLLVMGLIIGRRLAHLLIKIISVFTAIKLLSQMVYQVEYIHHKSWNTTCFLSGTNYTANDAEWLGFYKSKYMASIVEWNIVYIAVATLYSVILIRQYNYRIAMDYPAVRPFFVFPNIRRFDADKNVNSALKFLCNHGYYKFGYEISLMATVCLIGIRMDMYALCYAIWLCILCFLKRDVLRAGTWTLYLLFIAVTIPIQYISSVGILPSFCIEFPWDNSPLLRRLQEWAFLMDIKHPPNAKRLVCDFILLLLVARQRVVFRIEDRFKNREYPGGSNDSIIHHAEVQNFSNPVPDFITYARSYLDIFKRVTLLSFMWITLAALFLAGANRVNIFSVGYLAGSFIFLWQGTELYLKPLPSILRSWNCLICYSVIVIFLKAVFQLVGCVWIGEATRELCWLVQLLGIGCIDKFDSGGKISSPHGCYVPKESIGLAWDGVCFAFLIMQKRLFCSYNFFHIVDETKASTILASRGADLIEVFRQKRMEEQAEHEKLVLEKIKAKMDRIRATQEKIQGPNYQAADNHYIAVIYPRSTRPLYRRKYPKTNREAIRSGDYYMFDELDDDDDLDIIDSVKPPSDDEEDKERGINISTIEESPQKKRHSGGSEKYEPKPGPSREPDDMDLSIQSSQPQSKCQTIVDYLLYTWKLIDSLMVTIICSLNKHSKDFRYVRRVLIQEKKILKETTNYTDGIRLGRNKVWQPTYSYQALLSTQENTSGNTQNSQNEEAQPSGGASTKPKETSSQHSSPEKESSGVIEFEEKEGEISQYDQPTIVRLVIAVWYIIISNSEILCYVMIFLNQMKSATFMSLPLPLLVFFWGTLTIPRPTKSFWVTIIAYTQIIVLVKCIFQFEFWPWNQPSTVSLVYPYYPPKILGVEQNAQYAVWDLLLLLVVYFHRFLLKSLGLWTSSVVTIPVLSGGEYIVQEVKKGGKRPVESDEEPPADTDKTLTVAVTSDFAEPIDMFPETIQMSTQKYSEPIKEFIRQLRDPTSRASTDVYSYMFLCDFFNFFVILIGYTSFGQQLGDGGVSSYLQDNRVPHLFLLMLILQFLLIIVDRAIFLRKNITAKIVFQFIQIIVLHSWLFILFPIMTDRYFNSVIPPQMYYMVKCFYLLLSAYQIRCGYPSRILGNFLCKSYNYVNKFLFQGFMIVPFLFELRIVMDWMWTDTSMTVFDWIKMEDIFATIFQIKCIRRAENEYPQPRGEKKASSVKYPMGGFLLLIIIAIIWFPLVFFSLGNAVGQPNIPYDVTLTIRIGPYEPVYQLSAQANSIYGFTQKDYDILEDTYKKNKIALTFINNYQAQDIAAIKLSGESSTVWTISPPDRERMIGEVQSSNYIQIHLQYQISHKSATKEDSGLIREYVDVLMPARINGEPNPERQKLLQMLWGNTTSIPPVNLGYILPKFIKVTSRGSAPPVKQLMDEQDDPRQTYLRSLNLTLSNSMAQTPERKAEWWTIQENCSDFNYRVYLRKLSYGDCSSIMIYTFNDRIFPATLSIITAGGIIGVYTTLVFLASRFLRGFFSGICFKIMFDDMPNVDRVLQLCHDIYLVREAREFCLEEDLFAKLVFLFRSPETLIKWTRPKEEGEDEDNPEGDG